MSKIDKARETMNNTMSYAYLLAAVGFVLEGLLLVYAVLSGGVREDVEYAELYLIGALLVCAFGTRFAYGLFLRWNSKTNPHWRGWLHHFYIKRFNHAEHFFIRDNAKVSILRLEDIGDVGDGAYHHMIYWHKKEDANAYITKNLSTDVCEIVQLNQRDTDR